MTTRGMMAEGHSIHRPPYFDGTNYVHWKNRMYVFLRAQEYEVWRVIEKVHTFFQRMKKNGWNMTLRDLVLILVL